MFLAGDIGATKTRLGVFSSDKGLRNPFFKAEFSSAQYPNLEAVVSEFLHRVHQPLLRAAVFGVAGPIAGDQAEITNLPRWDIVDEKKLGRLLNVSSVRLINDLEATACALPLLELDDLCILNRGETISGGAMAVIAPGTGLGEAFLIHDGSCYHGHASQGGHADFAPNNLLEEELWHYLYREHGHVTYEMVCSGQGISNIYRFLRNRLPDEEPPWLSEKLANEKDPTPIIVDDAAKSEKPCDLCVQAIQMFVSILGAEVGNMALKVLATNGVYIAGGLPRRVLPFLQDGRFMKSFREKGPMTDLVSKIPVYVITYTDVALMGAACYAERHLPVI
jgi:glucokinase